MPEKFKFHSAMGFLLGDMLGRFNGIYVEEDENEYEEEKEVPNYTGRLLAIIGRPNFKRTANHQDFYYMLYEHNEKGQEILAEYYDDRDTFLWCLTFEYDEKGNKIAEKRYDQKRILVRTNRFFIR